MASKKKPARARPPAPGRAVAKKRASAAKKVAAKVRAIAPRRRAEPERGPSGARPGRRRASTTARRHWHGADAVPVPGAIAGLSEEDQIRSAKYLPRELPRRLFEEERFLFPETYGVNRIRLLVRDPEWIFAYWDVSPATMKELAKGVGERTLALSRLTLRVLDPVSGGSSDILLPPGARWWYIRTDSARRTYRAELGVTLPSGVFRRLAESNTVVTPRVGPSSERARRRLSYREAREIAPAAAEAAGLAERETGMAKEPWAAGRVDGAASPAESRTPRGGASDTFRQGGASDTFRPGAGDVLKR
jgi:hypothetical protein